MFGTLLRKRLSSDQFSNIFINAIFEATEAGFEVIADMMNNDPAFVVSPEIKKGSFDQFQLIILAANFHLLDKFFEPQEVEEIKSDIISKLAIIYNADALKIKEVIKHYYQFIQRVNHPSKNVLYGISKAIFFKYNLSDFQDEYFKRMQTPNPLFLKRLDHLIENFLWDWDVFMKKYKL